GDFVSYLEIAKRAAARLRAERAGNEGNEVNEVSAAPAAAAGTSFVSFVNFVGRPSGYARPWLDALPDVGARTIGPFDSSSRCAALSCARYGAVLLCLPCAKASEPAR